MLAVENRSLLKPVKIGSVTIETPLVLAPMAGVTSHAFRLLCRKHGAGLVVTELLSSHAIHYKNAKTFGMFDWTQTERPVSVQLFGGDPALMAEAAQVVEAAGADIVDLNMGCWVPKVAKTGAGAALMKDVCLAGDVIRAMVHAVKIPVTVKIRSGWDSRETTAIEFAQRAQDAGAEAIAVHARYASQGFTGTADWSVIRRVKDVVTIPVFGNGDVTTPQDARKMIDETGCDGVMIGRGAMGNPWIFSETKHFLQTGEIPPPPSLPERIDAALSHLKTMAANPNMGEERAVREMRGQLPHYFKGFPGVARLRAEMVRLNSIEEIEYLLRNARAE
ncbi:MAG TPA: tRNA dihydrouridine synthase DusB [Capsulimonadaceae bacterium]|nr:tRNA dihydrouridine synthase DusB [Capsulimonadaceae bacterium]